jgi:hypothetical protein
MLGSHRISAADHFSHPWRIHQFTKEFHVLDVWALPTPGGPGDFPRLVNLWPTFDPGRTSPIVRSLFAVRWSLGRVLGLDRPETGFGGRVPALADRIPAELRTGATEFGSNASPFEPLYVTESEFASEIANQTVHGVLHVGWVEDRAGGYRGQLAVLVRPNGISGRAYLAAIAPFRHLIVYPLMLRELGRLWRDRTGASDDYEENSDAN